MILEWDRQWSWMFLLMRFVKWKMCPFIEISYINMCINSQLDIVERMSNNDGVVEEEK